ncbi:hypothetical protein SAMN05421853_1231 [Roseivivax halotolerans]|uniref:Uncharacterized protein n=1 Tax=Roseivivax halotolerans TaxID=93684 RepID=A0A1I6AK77_9RHOB|nr:hypothetical protein [Roseivivax halotolerans]SFQ69074.1 hypothetical protein SAMN05421853_1231 [Roseivivax halotolerans]
MIVQIVLVSVVSAFLGVLNDTDQFAALLRHIELIAVVCDYLSELLLRQVALG